MRLNGTITNIEEKRQILEASLRNLDIVVKQLRKLRLPLDFPADELVPLVQQLRDHRSSLTILLRHFSREIKDPND